MAAHPSAVDVASAPLAPPAARRPFARRLLRAVIATVAGVHALLHLLGVVEASGLAYVPEIGPLPPVAGALWASAALAVGVAAIAMARRWPRWWVTAGLGAVVSQVALQTAWHDARAGTAVNVVLAAAALYGYAAEGPRSTRTAYERHVRGDLAGAVARSVGPVLTEADLERLPPAVARYVRRSGAVGRPRVLWFRARLHGRIRSGPHAAWMPFVADQVNTFGPFPTRTFLMNATRAGLPVDVLHRFDAAGATMRARLCSSVTIVDESGPEMDQAETVTVLNEAVLFAPAVLVDLPLEWSVLEPDRVRVSWTIGACTVTAVLVIDAHGDLVDFVSDDRRRAGDDGLMPVRWSTPVGAYRSFSGVRLPGAGHGRWHTTGPDGTYTYIELALDHVEHGPPALFA